MWFTCDTSSVVEELPLVLYHLLLFRCAQRCAKTTTQACFVQGRSVAWQHLFFWCLHNSGVCRHQIVSVYNNKYTRSLFKILVSPTNAVTKYHYYILLVVIFHQILIEQSELILDPLHKEPDGCCTSSGKWEPQIMHPFGSCGPWTSVDPWCAYL